jgi:hypothetical protein
VAPQSADIAGGVAGAGVASKLPVAGAGGDLGILGNIAAAFSPLSGLDVAAIPIAQFLAAADAVVPLYDVLFGTGAGGGFVGNRLVLRSLGRQMRLLGHARRAALRNQLPPPRLPSRGTCHPPAG